MPTTVITGGTLTLTIGGTARSQQITSATLTNDTTRNRFTLIGGTTAHKVVDDQWSLACEILQDWSSGTSDFMDYLWTARSTNPDTSIAFVLTSNSQTFSGNIYPEYPNVGGAANSELTTSLTFMVDGAITKA
jgi:hypothetical protein